MTFQVSHLPSRARGFVVGGVALVLSFASGLLQAQTIQFDALAGKEGKKAEASYVVFNTPKRSKGTLATVVELGADMNKATLVVDGKKIPLTFLVNDVNSRLALYQLPDLGKESVGKEAVLASSLTLTPATQVFDSPDSKSSPSRVVARITRFQGKILPLAVLQVNHPKSAPRPGSGMYDAEGKLIGLVRQAVFGEPQSSYCLPSEVLSRTMADFVSHGKIRRCWIGIVMDDLVAPPIVESVRPGSPAKKAGLKKGDRILSIGKREVNSYSEVVDVFFYFIAGEVEVFKVLRGTEVKEITVTPMARP